MLMEQGPSKLSNRQQHLLSCNEVGKKRLPLYQQYLEKPNSVLVKDDIEGAEPRSMLERKTSHYNKRYQQERGQDRYESNYHQTPLEHNHPDIVQFKTTRQPTNPLDPIYRTASFSKSQAPITKFIKDPLEVKDIPGAQASRPKQLNINTLTNHIYFPQKQQQKVISEHNSLKVKDINKDQVYSHLSSRQCNPLTPLYNIHQSQLTLDDQKSHQKVKAPLHRQHDHFDVSDIIGNNICQQINAKPTHSQPTPIPGTQSGSLHKAIRTNRGVNPLVPHYKLLDGTTNQI